MNDITLYIKSMGKLLEVTAKFSNDEDANKYMKNNKNEGVVAVDKYGIIYLANLYDKGNKII